MRKCRELFGSGALVLSVRAVAHKEVGQVCRVGGPGGCVAGTSATAAGSPNELYEFWRAEGGVRGPGGSAASKSATTAGSPDELYEV